MMFGLIGMLVCDNGGRFNEPDRPDTGFFFEDTGGRDTDEDCTPWIDVEPDTLSFASSDGEPLTRALTIYNGGDCELQILDYELLSDEQAFAVEGLGGVVEARGQATAEVTFSPASPGEYSATLEILSTDPYLPIVSVTLSGAWDRTAAVGVPRVDEEEVNLGVVEVGCGLSYAVEVHNDGDAALTLSEISLSTASEDFTLLTEAPLLVPVDGVGEVSVTYTPLDRYEDSATLSLSGDGEPAELLVTLSATPQMGEELELRVNGDGVTRAFQLPVQVVPALLVVSLDGVPLSEGWAFDGDDNAVVFDEAMTPAEESVVEIGYLPQPECD